jgi:hypothetical protein
MASRAARVAGHVSESANVTARELDSGRKRGRYSARAREEREREREREREGKGKRNKDWYGGKRTNDCTQHDTSLVTKRTRGVADIDAEAATAHL